MPDKKSTSALNLDSLVQRVEKELARLNRMSPSGSKSIVFYPPDGSTWVRILPPLNGQETFFRTVGYHHIPANNEYGKIVRICNRVTFDEACPVCEVRERLLKSNNEIEQELARSLNPFIRGLMLAVVIGWKRTPTDPNFSIPPRLDNYTLDYLRTHPVILVLSKSAFAELLDQFRISPNIIDPKNGVSVVINRFQKGKQVNYSISLHTDPIDITDALENAPDLEEYVRNNQRDYEQLLGEMVSALTEKNLVTPTIEEIGSVVNSPSIPSVPVQNPPFNTPMQVPSQPISTTDNPPIPPTSTTSAPTTPPAPPVNAVPTPPTPSAETPVTPPAPQASQPSTPPLNNIDALRKALEEKLKGAK